MPGANVPPDAVWPNFSFALHFATGLLLEPNRVYTWRVKVDHETREEWTEKFYVFTPSPGAVLG